MRSLGRARSEVTVLIKGGCLDLDTGRLPSNDGGREWDDEPKNKGHQSWTPELAGKPPGERIEA